MSFRFAVASVLAALGALVFVTCSSSLTTVECSGGVVCPAVTGCTPDGHACVSASGCGDGVVGASEQCDDGNQVDTDDCRTGCTLNVCGDGALDTQGDRTDTCDDGNDSSGDDCVAVSGQCRPARCGDGHVDGQGPHVETCDDGNDAQGDECRDDCQGKAACGNGVADPGEQCDPGAAMQDTADCDRDCTVPRCGDGHRNAGASEACDPGSMGTVAGSTATCNHDCTVPACGDGLVNRAFTPMNGAVPEQCDDGNTAPDDGCSAVCRIESCGNGVVESGNHEQCDDGNGTDTDGCRNNCQLPRCGDGLASTPPLEVCDTNGDSPTCNANCTTPACGDGRVNPLFTPDGGSGPEACDDANTVAGDGCSALCGIEGCGDGAVAADAGEQCDDGNALDTDACRNNCQSARCGDGVVRQGAESCDTAGNSASCDSDCTVPECGDGVVNALTLPLAEQCEDGNTASGDGCSATCRLEPFQLTVVKSGDGTGVVTSTPAGLDCGGDCTELYGDGAIVTLSAAPAANATFAGWSGACSGAGPCTLTLDGPKTATATFAANRLTVTRSGSGSGTVTATAPAGIINCGADCSETVDTGTMVTLVASPNASSLFSGWSGGGCNGTGNCTVPVNQATSVDARFTLRDFTLSLTKAGLGAGTVTSGPLGLNCGPSCLSAMFDYTADTMVVLSAAPEADSLFSGWSGSGCSGTGQCQVTMSMARSVTATFARRAFTVRATRTGPGGTVTSSPAGVNCGSDCNESYLAGTTVTLTATPLAGDAFVGWSGGPCLGTLPCTFTVAGDVTVNAAFTDNTLTVVRTGGGTGTITSSPAGITCGSDCFQDYNAGTSVTLTATAAAGARFTGWTGGGCGATSTCAVTLNAPTTVTADFVRTFTLTLTKAGSGAGTVTSAPGGLSCGDGCPSASGEFDDQTVVILSAVAGSGSVFVGWSGSGCSGTGSCVVTMSQARTVTAQFALAMTLNVGKAGTGAALGTVQSSPAGIDCGNDCSEAYVEGTVVTLVAATSGGATFTTWSGAAGCTTATTCLVTMSAARNVTATFAAPSFTLTVTKAGAGAANGTVTASPAGINCGADCSEAYTSGTMVTLFAAVANGATFTGWSGAAGCTTATTCVVTVTAARTVTATFSQP